MFEQNAAGDNFKKEVRTRFFANILKLCVEWTDTIPYDFRSAVMQERLEELLSLCAVVDQPSQRKADDLMIDLRAKVSC
jgi:hypothetical protein